MAIVATNNSQPREIIPGGNYVARCFQMIQIGTIEEEIMGEKKTLHKVIINFELPTELKEFKDGEGEKPYAISKEFTLSLHEKASLRKFLAGWRSKDFTEEEAKSFDITRLLGVPCLLNVIHKTSKAGSVYAEISNASPVPKGMTVPPQINNSRALSYDSFDWDLFTSLPDFIKQKMQRSAEYAKLTAPDQFIDASPEAPVDDLPF